MTKASISIFFLCAFNLLSCKENSSRDTMSSYKLCNSCNSLDINKVIGKEYAVNSYSISEGKVLIKGSNIHVKNESIEYKKGYIFIIDIATQTLIYHGLNPTFDYIGYSLAIEGDKVAVTHALEPEDIYIIDLKTKVTVQKHIHFDETANSPGIIMMNGDQLFMIQNIYGFALADLKTSNGKVFSGSLLGDTKSTISMPIGLNINLLSGKKTDSGVVALAIERNNSIKWEKIIKLNEIYSNDMDKVEIFSFEDKFIVKYNNKVEAWSKNSGEQLWINIQKDPIDHLYLYNGKLIVYSFINTSKMILSDNEPMNNKNIIASYIEYIKSIDLNTGKEVWQKEFRGEEHNYGILRNNMILKSDSSWVILSLATGARINNHPFNFLDKNSMRLLTDSKTGQLYTDVNGVLYW